MSKVCIRDQAPLEKVEMSKTLDYTASFRIATDSEARDYDAYECVHCGMLYFYRKDTD